MSNYNSNTYSFEKSVFEIEDEIASTEKILILFSHSRPHIKVTTKTKIYVTTPYDNLKINHKYTCNIRFYALHLDKIEYDRHIWVSKFVFKPDLENLKPLFNDTVIKYNENPFYLSRDIFNTYIKPCLPTGHSFNHQFILKDVKLKYINKSSTGGIHHAFKFDDDITLSKKNIYFCNNIDSPISEWFVSKEEQKAVNESINNDVYKRYKLRKKEYMIRVPYDNPKLKLLKHSYYTCNIKFQRDSSKYADCYTTYQCHLAEITPYTEQLDDPFLTTNDNTTIQPKPKVKKSTTHSDDVFLSDDDTIQGKPKVKRVLPKSRHVDDLFLD